MCIYISNMIVPRVRWRRLAPAQGEVGRKAKTAATMTSHLEATHCLSFT